MGYGWYSIRDVVVESLRAVFRFVGYEQYLIGDLIVELLKSGIEICGIWMVIDKGSEGRISEERYLGSDLENAIDS